MARPAGLVDSDLANGMKNGYAIRYVIVGASTLGAPAKYELAATPLQYGRTGNALVSFAIRTAAFTPRIAMAPSAARLILRWNKILGWGFVNA